MPRAVFHGVPTLEEAKEATSELILGIEKIYPWSSNSQVEQAKASVGSEITTEPAVPTTVYTAFRLLRESSEAQNVVASIARDPNVVKAVRQNQQLQELLHSEKRLTGAERLDELYAESMEDTSNDAESKSGIEDLITSKASVSSEITTEPAVPTTVYTAFRLLRESSEAQNVVASIARDPNVVKAVRHNQQLQEFLHLEKRRWASLRSVTCAERLDELYAESIEDPSNDAESKPGIEDLVTSKASVSSEITTEPVVPPTVYTAFRLLHESSEAQNVVASIACDPNVVQAVRQNQQLQEFLDLEKRRWASSLSVTGAERLDGIEDPSNYAESKPGISFENLLKIIKDMVDMVKNASDLFKKLFGRKGDNSSAYGDHVDPGASDEHVLEASLLGLAIMVIMLIVLKRV